MTKKKTKLIPKKPLLLIFREILPGDVKKQLAKSNITQSGGGARDLRLRNAKLWVPFLARMFTTPTSTSRVYKQVIYWIEPSGVVRKSTASYWQPTKARPNELRIGKIHQIKGWKVDEIAFKEAKTRGKKWFYCLCLDEEDKLWARIIREENLGLESKEVRDYVQKRIKETRQQATVYGAINLSDLHQTLEAHISSEQIQLLNHVTLQKKPSAQAVEAIDEVTRGQELEEIIDEWVKQNEGSKPAEIKRRVKLLKRCYGLVKVLKEKYDYRCQIDTCRFTFRMRNGRYYCEAAHIRPLSGRKTGVDSPKNILILCPNHHKMLDYGAMKVISSNKVKIGEKKFKIIV